MERRLAAILAADIVGYSHLMGADEAGTLNHLKTTEAEVIEPAVTGHHGRIVKRMGDGFLVEFASVVEAVECAIAWQRIAREPISFRIGIHLGDVMVEEDDLYGDGVNVAARLQGMCEPGGVALSEDAYRQVRDRMDLEWRDGGEQKAKNIARPLRIWHWTGTETAVKEKFFTAETPLALPEKPSIAVLPFVNLSGDPDQDFFSDGITEDLISALSRIRTFFVISRDSSFEYKSQRIEPARIRK